MIGLNLAIVHSQVPSRHGVQVLWRSLASQDGSDPTDDGYGFCRVMARRAHPSLGTEMDLPDVGELGLVATIDSEVNVWLGSIHWQEDNAIIPGLSLDRHDSGVVRQINANGECQINLPGGVVMRSTIADADLTVPSGQPHVSSLGANLPTYLALEHPSGLLIDISPQGDVAITGANSLNLTNIGQTNITGFGTVNLATQPLLAGTLDPNWSTETQPNIDININAGSSGGTAAAINLTATGNIAVAAPNGTVTVSGQNVQLQNGGNADQFVMKAAWTFLKAHTHPGNNTPPASVPPDVGVISPTTLKGQHG